MANILDRYLPEKAKKAAEVGLDPVTVFLGLWSIASQCQANEKALVAQFLAAQRNQAPPAPPKEQTAPDVDLGAMAQEMADPNKVLERSSRQGACDLSEAA